MDVEFGKLAEVFVNGVGQVDQEVAPAIGGQGAPFSLRLARRFDGEVDVGAPGEGNGRVGKTGCGKDVPVVPTRGRRNAIAADQQTHRIV
ncbi:hypothetical protein GCM10023114_51150 [Mycolicibacterium sediminis]|uniref:Uncharacterized protein n=1 Tax=Mycolicibacterium sediminis TaxID=1286180 RepID=A0A7I7QLI5_9MYCO|nr:hypothetical protein MSEDJ_12280 [Mycolicibacterium sediminis]